MFISTDEVHLYFISLDPSGDRLEKLASLLSEDEIIRANRYHFPQHKRRFLVARGCLREILGSYLTISPEKIEFIYSERGKPSINHQFQFNLSHSEEMAICGLTLTARIGVDLEKMRQMKDLDSLTKRFFCAREHELVEKSAEKEKLFFQLWTAKEAYLKALGTGISGGLDRVEVGLNPLKLDNVAGEWQLWTAAIGDNYRATVVIEGSDRVIKTFGLSDL
ncbi:MAG: 4'-phosphopantetheinyl transferase family protein [Microcystis aeruginosa]